jgi:hypothetical protein
MIACMARRLVLAAACCFLLAAAPAQAGLSPSQALPILNQWRSEAHLPTLPAFDSAENDGCAKHNHYMALNGNQLTHEETNGNPGYTTEGATAGAQSVLAQPEGTPRIWEGSVYHRMGILNPRMTKSGWAATEGFTCMRIFDLRNGNGSEPVKTYPWPPNGGTGVPTRFTDFESPDPHDLVPGELGYLLSVNLGGPWFGNYTAHVSVAHASLKTQSGTPVTLTIVDDDTSGGGPGGSDIGPYLNDAFALFPHGALKGATTYVAHADGKATYSGTDYPFNVTWSFKTAGQTVAGKTNLKFSKPSVKNGKVRFPLAASKSLVGRKGTVLVNGKVRNRIALKLSQTIKVNRPAKGKTVKVKVTTAKFTRDGVAYPAAKASKSFTRKP